MKRTISKAIKATVAPFRGSWWERAIAWFLTSVLCLLLLFGAIDVNFLWLFGSSPGFSDIKRPPVVEASIIYSADSVQIGSYYSENRIPITYEEISPIVVRTLVSTEDVRFFRHHGVDIDGLFATTKDILKGNARGGSTITQQLAKNLFKVRSANGWYTTGLLGCIPCVRICVMKAKEWIVAMKLEMVYSKEDIITMYLNTVDFGCNSYGIKTASAAYFATTPHQLTYEQAATLVGLLKATSTYNPRLNPERCVQRRNLVLDNLYRNNQMVINGYHATPIQLDSLKSLPLLLSDCSDKRGNLGIVPYFRNALEDHIAMLCEQGSIAGYDADNKLDPYSEGLRIYTSLDTRIQRYAEDAVRQQMRVVQSNFRTQWGSEQPWQDANHREIPHFIENIAKRTAEYRYLVCKYGADSDSVDYYLNLPHTVTLFTYNGPEDKQMSLMDSIRYMVSYMHCGLVAIEPDTREIKAWVGDIDFSTWQYDKVTSRRQPGSTFKLFVYTEAMNQGLTPCDRRPDIRITYPLGGGRTWTPHNSGGGYSGVNIRLRNAFAQSVNTIAVSLGQELGVNNVVCTARVMGIESPMQENLSLCLGASDVSLLEMANAYCTIADDGKYSPPIMVTQICDRDGNVIYEGKTSEQQAIPYRSAYLMQKLLQGGLEPGGTSAGLWAYIRPILDTGTQFGGKTGTTNNYSDAWYMGVTPGLVAGVWVGGEYRSIHFRSSTLGQGARAAMPIYGLFMQKLLKDRRFSKYYRAFAAEPREPISPKCWSCEGYYVATSHNAGGTVTSVSDSLTSSATTIFSPDDIDYAPSGQ